METALQEIATRFRENPLITPEDIAPSREDMVVECILNPGVFRFDGKTWLLLRVAERPVQREGRISLPVFGDDGKIEILEFDTHDPGLDLSDPRVINYNGKDYLTTLSHLRLVCSDNGTDFREVPGFGPIFGKGALETFGIEDCRVTEIEGNYHLTFTMVSQVGVGVGLITTRDWKNFARRGMIFPPHNKDCAIFNRRINGKYHALHRPSSPQLGGNYIWISESPDLLHWGNHRCVATTRPGMWDSARIGAGAAPILTSDGWLELYHGADAANRYCLGALLLDTADPSRVLARSQAPIMEPAAGYELSGFFGKVVFTNGHLVEGDTISMYYGASDSVICGARLSIKEILRTLAA